MEFTVNGTAYIVDESEAGSWFWSSAAAESEGFFPDAASAQQDAINHERNLITELRAREEQEHDDLRYGTYEDQVNRYFKSTRGC